MEMIVNGKYRELLNVAWSNTHHKWTLSENEVLKTDKNTTDRRFAPHNLRQNTENLPEKWTKTAGTTKLPDLLQ